jgi:biotin carboxyl carrier protein
MNTGKGKRMPAKKKQAVSSGLPSNFKTDELIRSPIPGTVTRVFVSPGQEVKTGKDLFVIESMKMRNTIRAAFPGKVARIGVKEQQVIQAGQILIEFMKKGK